MLSRYPSRRLHYPAPLASPESFLSALEHELESVDYDVLMPMELSTLLLLSDVRQRCLERSWAAHVPSSPLPDSSVWRKDS